MSVGLSSLPDEVLKLVLQHVPVQYRLSSCCLVNKRLHAAAVAATQDLQLWFGDDQHPSKGMLIPRDQEGSFLDWTLHHGQHLTRLELDRFQRPLQQLLCTNLQDLRLNRGCAEVGLAPSYFRVQLGAADGQSGVIAGCTKLTRLELNCDIIDVPARAVVSSFSSLVHLQHLDALAMKYVAHRGAVECALGGFSGATLPRLQDLTYLTGWLSVENLQQLGELTRLQYLSFAVDDMAVDLGVLRSVPGLVFPASLTYLGIGSGVEAGVLSSFPTGLRHVRLAHVAEGPPEGPGSLLCCMSRLQHLTQLSLKCRSSLDWPPAGSAYSALTASSNLEEVLLHGCKLPKGVWPHVFPAARKLPQLTRLSFSLMFRDEEDVPWWGAADLSSLVSCCPNLCDLIDITLQYGLHVSELHQLSALTKLHVNYPSDDWYAFEESLEGLTAVRRLRFLRIAMPHGNEDTDITSFQPLTQLTALTHIEFSNVPARPPDGPVVITHFELDFCFSAQVDDVPSVSWILNDEIECSKCMRAYSDS